MLLHPHLDAFRNVDPHQGGVSCKPVFYRFIISRKNGGGTESPFRKMAPEILNQETRSGKASLKVFALKALDRLLLSA